MPVNRWAPVVSVLALCLGLVFLLGSWPAQPASPPRGAVSALTSSPAASSTLSSTSDPSVSPSPTPTPTIPPGYRIKIARLSIDLPLAEGDIDRDTVRQETPENFAFHLPGTAIPGDGSNSYIYAHARTGMFLTLWSAREGDQVTITTPDGRELRYVVSEVHPRIDPSDVTWAARTSGERLTLQTSTGPNPGDPRFVVIALPI
jgi:LPXTG-site transpeptidase (sortase) family protein